MKDDIQTFDVVVIGAGPGGYVSAIRAAQLGLTVCCIDDWVTDGKPAPGGTCTNVGCIPSKALLASSCLFEEIRDKASEHGIHVEEPTIDVPTMIARKAKIVRQTNDGILYLFRKNKITFLNGRGFFVTSDEDGYLIGVEGRDETRVFAKNVVLATGSKPRQFPGVPFDEERILSNEGALKLKSVPSTLGIIGAGVIGLELGSVWKRLGADVRILEAMPSLLPFADSAISREALKAFKQQGIDMEFGVHIDSIQNDGDRVIVQYKDKDGKNSEMWVDRLIISIGRVPFIAALDAPVVGFKLDERGFVEVDAENRTNLPRVWAIGDLVKGPMLAHKAEEEGVAVAERIAGRKAVTHIERVPSVVYTEPEIAWVGKTEDELKNAGKPYKVGVFPFMANGRARAVGETQGFVKMLADAETDLVLGLHIIGPQAGELIAQGCDALSFGATAEDLALICDPHPTFSEAIKEAALAVNKEGINF